MSNGEQQTELETLRRIYASAELLLKAAYAESEGRVSYEQCGGCKLWHRSAEMGFCKSADRESVHCEFFCRSCLFACCDCDQPYCQRCYVNYGDWSRRRCPSCD